MNKDIRDIIHKTKRINIKLRKTLFDLTPKLEDIRRIPFHGKMVEGMPTESLGPFPEFILPTHPCAKTLQGYCSPCFFSKIPMSGRSSAEIYDSFVTQTQYIIDHFDELIIDYQARDDSQYPYDITFCYACNGSLFSNSETSCETRYIALKMLVDEIETRGLSALVYFETCVTDYIRLLNSDEFSKIFPLLKKLNAVMLFGFESYNEITRNLIYLKDLSLSDFEFVVDQNAKLGLASGAFLYLGYHSMTQNEIIEDAKNSILYLTQKNVMPVLMFPNIHEYTLTHLLYYYGKYNLIDPQTALSIFSFANNYARQNQNFINNKCDPWLMGDLFGGPPAPPTNFFNNKNKISCDHCTELIRRTLQDARQSLALCSLENVYNQILLCECQCGEKYIAYLQEEDHKSQEKDIIERIKSTICFAEDHCEEYLQEMNRKRDSISI